MSRSLWIACTRVLEESHAVDGGVRSSSSGERHRSSKPSANKMVGVSQGGAGASGAVDGLVYAHRQLKVIDAPEYRSLEMHQLSSSPASSSIKYWIQSSGRLAREIPSRAVTIAPADNCVESGDTLSHC